MRRRAYIGLGANLGDPPAQITAAMDVIAMTEGVAEVARSRLYRSAPMGGLIQPWYCNAVMSVDTALSPATLLQRLLDVERAAGRERGGTRWSSRRLDLDLLHVEGLDMNSPELRLPHHGLASRNFVLAPLAEIAPDLTIPRLGAVAELARAAGGQDLELWSATAGLPT